MKRLSKRTAHKSVLAFRAIVASLILFASLSLARAQETPALDGPQATFQDELLDKMAGNWTLSGQIAGRSAQHSIEAKWTLNHQFLQIHEIDKNPTKGPPGYEAFAFIGYDHLSERYLIHWIDIFLAAAHPRQSDMATVRAIASNSFSSTPRPPFTLPSTGIQPRRAGSGT